MEDITTSNYIQALSTDLQKECFCTDDGWSHIFTFLGKGHYLLLALVCKRFAKLYAKLYPKTTHGDISGHSLTYAKFFFSEWKPRLPFQPENMHDRIKYRDGTEFILSYIERCAAKCGTINILEWMYKLEGDYRLELFHDTSNPKSDEESSLELFRGKLARRMSVVQANEAAVEANQVQVLKFLLEKYHVIEKDSKYLYKLVKNAAGKGHLQCIKFLYENGCYTDEDRSREQIYDCQSAARHGQLECLRYLKEQGWPIDSSVILEAAEAGHLHCIQYLRSVECPWEDEENVSEDDEFGVEITEACAGSSVECLRYCHDNGCNIDLNLSCMAAVKNGKIDCIQYLRSKGVPWSADFTEEAAEHDQLDCLQYLHNNGCPWNELACLKAVRRDADRCLQYLHENGCEWQSDVLIREALHFGKLDCLKYLLRVGSALPTDYESILSGPILSGNEFRRDRLPRDPITQRVRILRPKGQYKECRGYCLQYLKETGQDDSKDLMLKAISHGFAQTLQHLSSEEMKDDTTIAGYAANHGQLECLTYLHENGFRWDENSYTGYLRENQSQMHSHMDCLRYMKEHELETNQNALLHTIRAGHVYCIDFLIKDEWKSNDTFCMEAIRNGHLHCFEVLIERGFTFDPKLCAVEAASLGNIACLEYMHMNGFALPREALDAAESNGRIDCIEYVRQHFQCECKDETSRKRSANDANLDNI